MRLGQLIQAYETKVPLSLSLPIDSNGLKLGSVHQDVERVLGCLELTPEVAAYVIAEKIDCVFVHHDPFFIPLKSLQDDDAHAATILMLARHGVALYVSHTNLDIVRGGLNDYMFTRLGGTESAILDEANGIGRFGSINTPLPLSDYVNAYVTPLQKNFRIIANNRAAEIKTIGVVSGAGASYIRHAQTLGIDLFIAGDIDYHSAMLAREYNMPVIDIGHDAEYLVHDVFTRILTEIQTETAINFSIVTGKAFNFCPW
jgi:dinuclear metal center YbgI/SA1388 family protein